MKADEIIKWFLLSIVGILGAIIVFGYLPARAHAALQYERTPESTEPGAIIPAPVNFYVEVADAFDYDLGSATMVQIFGARVDGLDVSPLPWGWPVSSSCVEIDTLTLEGTYGVVGAQFDSIYLMGFDDPGCFNPVADYYLEGTGDEIIFEIGPPESNETNGDTVFMLAILIFLQALVACGILFNTFTRK